jgi:hypothetical protein
MIKEYILKSGDRKTTCQAHVAKSTKRWWKLETKTVVYVIAVECPAIARIEN